MHEFTLPTTRSSGSSRARAEDYKPLQLQRLATTNTAYHGALLAERELRREIVSTLRICAATSEDATFVKRLEMVARSSSTPQAEAEAERLLKAFKVALYNVERVSPEGPTPPRAA